MGLKKQRSTEKNVIAISSTGGACNLDLNCKSTLYLGIYADNVFFCYDGFYDVEGNNVIDLSEYAGLIKNRPQFINGECELIAEKSNGSRYKAIIDLNGDFISDFVKING